MNSTRTVHRKMREVLSPRQARLLGRAVKYVIECSGDTCSVVKESAPKVRVHTCKDGCRCAPCKKREADGPVPKVRARLVESHSASKASALLRASLGKAKRLLSKRASERNDITDDVPLDSFADDLRRKKSLKKVMGPEADVSKRPADVDAWSTSEEGEVPPGTISGDPILSPTLSEDEDWEDLDGEGGCQDYLKDAEGPEAECMPTKSKRKSEAVRAFEASAGDGMTSTGGMTPVLGEDPDADGRLQPDDPAVNYRFSADRTGQRRCGTCRFYMPDQADNPEGGGSCERVMGLIRSIDVCDLFAPKPDAEQTFDKEYED